MIKNFLACKIVFTANHQNPGNIQRISRLQNCLSRKSSKSWNYSKNFSPAKLSQPQIVSIPDLFKDFFACKIVLAANHQNPGKIQRLSRLLNCLCRKSSKSWKYSKNFSPAKLSQPQIIKIMDLFKDFFACKIVLAANHQNRGSVQRPSRLQKCLRRKSSKSWNYSKTFSPAKLSQPQIIKIVEMFKDLLACKIVLAANHQNPGIIERISRLQNCLSRKSSKSWK